MSGPWEGLRLPWTVAKSGNPNFDLCILASDGGSVCHMTRWSSDREVAERIVEAMNALADSECEVCEGAKTVEVQIPYEGQGQRIDCPECVRVGRITYPPEPCERCGGGGVIDSIDPHVESEVRVLSDDCPDCGGEPAPEEPPADEVVRLDIRHDCPGCDAPPYPIKASFKRDETFDFECPGCGLIQTLAEVAAPPAETRDMAVDLLMAEPAEDSEPNYLYRACRAELQDDRIGLRANSGDEALTIASERLNWPRDRILIEHIPEPANPLEKWRECSTY